MNGEAVCRVAGLDGAFCCGVDSVDSSLYDEVFNSDDVDFGGSGVGNGTGIEPVLMKIHGCNQGLSLTLPPMGVIYLKCRQV